MEQCSEQDIIDLLEAGDVYWDVVLLQEGPTREEGSCTIIAGGHAFYVGKAGSSNRTTCVLLHRRWTIAKLSFYALNGRISYLDLEAGSLKLGLASAHLPHADIHEDVYETTLDSLEETVINAKRLSQMNIIGIDANAVAGRQMMTDDDCTIGECGMGFRNPRGHIFATWLHGSRLAVSATMLPKPWESTWTHELWSNQLHRQIDFVSLDEVRSNTLEDVGIECCLDGKSDHRAAFARIRLRDYERGAHSRRRVQVRWVSKT
jgi:hypothetical protein